MWAASSPAACRVVGVDGADDAGAPHVHRQQPVTSPHPLIKTVVQTVMVVSTLHSPVPIVIGTLMQSLRVLPASVPAKSICEFGGSIKAIVFRNLFGSAFTFARAGLSIDLNASWNFLLATIALICENACEMLSAISLILLWVFGDSLGSMTAGMSPVYRLVIKAFLFGGEPTVRFSRKVQRSCLSYGF